MDFARKLTIINDPIYGFITIPDPLVYRLIEHPYFQRLRRISQMGMSYLVFPGAHHTRFEHALGALHLMQRAVSMLRKKGVPISGDEANGLYVAILLHDMGHGPFSHAMENSIVLGTDHEDLSIKFIEYLNDEFNGAFDLALEIFLGSYPRKFFRQLVSGQLDMDRLDYLRRDSFYAGVAEGTINSERLIAMLNVHEDKLVVEEKGVYSVEKFLIARRLMYWQVYLHKTGLVAEQLLVKVLSRARELSSSGENLESSRPLSYFLRRPEGPITPSELKLFAQLDDYDVVSAMKAWQGAKDPVLRELCTMLLERRLLKIKLSDEPFNEKELRKRQRSITQSLGVSMNEAAYFAFTGAISNQAYDITGDNINLLRKSGEIVDVAEASDHFNLKTLSKVVTKHFVCYPKLE